MVIRVGSTKISPFILTTLPQISVEMNCIQSHSILATALLVQAFDLKLSCDYDLINKVRASSSIKLLSTITWNAVRLMHNCRYPRSYSVVTSCSLLITIILLNRKQATCLGYLALIIMIPVPPMLANPSCTIISAQNKFFG